MTAARAERIEPLDGLRGLAALWVLAGHALNLSGAWIPVIGRPLLAVDLFMMLSGALMFHQAGVREAREPMASPRTWLRFWTRRFFRIAPVFYLAFAAAMVLGPWLGEMRQTANAAIGAAPPDALRYQDHGWVNVLAHLSFVFGALPAWSTRSPLPDWSIGLEMQFYLAFPFILLATRRLGLVAASVLLTGASALLWLPLGGWLGAFDPDTPSFLPLKINAFLAGMMLMRARLLTGWSRWGLLLPAVALAAVPLGPAGHWSEPVIRAASALAVGAALSPGLFSTAALESLAGLGRRLLASPPLRWMGDVSYGVYLIHLLVLGPVVALLVRQAPDLVPMARAGLAFALSAPLVYGLGWATFRWIETPGIALGRRLLSRPGT